MHTLGITDVVECVVGEEIVVECLVAVLLVDIASLADTIVVLDTSSKLLKAKAVIGLLVTSCKYQNILLS